jgi:hypothetical protein
MPWMLPEGDVSGVLMSPCASIQSRPTRFPWRWANEAIPDTVPTAME